MKKFICIAMVLVVAVLLISGCSGNLQSTMSEETSASEGSSSSQSKTSSGKVSLTVYSPHSEDMLNDLKTMFEVKYPEIEVQIMPMGGSTAVERIRAEKANPVADIIYGNTTAVFNQLKEEGLLETYKASWMEGLDSSFYDKDYYWGGTMQDPIVVVYNKNHTTPLPEDWYDLGNDPLYQDKFMILDNSSAAAQAFLSIIADQFYQKGTLDTEGWDWFAKFNNNLKARSEAAEMVQKMASMDGGVEFAAGVTLSAVINLMEMEQPFDYVRDMKSGLPVITDCIAIVKGSKNLDAAQKFVEFAGGEEFQLYAANNYNRMPTIASAIEKSEKEWMKEDFTIMEVDWDNISKNQQAWIQKLENEIFDK